MKISITFNNEVEGALTEKTVNRLFDNPRAITGPKEGFCKIVKDPLNSSKKVLQVKYTKGMLHDGSSRWRLKFPEPVESATVEYKVMFAPDFDFVRGGKLPGFGGGDTPAGGAKSNGTNGFTARIMWREKGEIFQYMYWMERAKEKKWGDDLPWVDVEGDMKPFRFIPGKWHTLKTRIVMNTHGERDGNITSWFDDQLALTTKGAFRAKEANFGIDVFIFTTFFGGNDPSWAPRKDEVAYFGDISIEF